MIVCFAWKYSTIDEPYTGNRHKESMVNSFLNNHTRKDVLDVWAKKWKKAEIAGNPAKILRYLEKDELE